METGLKVDLEDFWEIFEYQVAMYLFTRNVLILKPPVIWNNMNLRTAIIESYLLHTRILVDILAPRKQSTRKDDLTLLDLNIDFSSTINIDNMQNELREAYGDASDENSPCWMINKMFAHPTKWRSSSHDWGSTLNTIEPFLVTTQASRVKST